MKLLLSAYHKCSGHTIIGIGDSSTAASIAFGNSRSRVPICVLPSKWKFGDLFHSMFKAKLTFAKHDGWILNMKTI